MAGLGLFGAGCHSADAVLLTVTGDQPAQQYDLYVRDDATSQIIFHSGFNPVQAAGEMPRDITKQKLKIALKLAKGGKYTLLLIGVIGDVDGSKPAMGATQMFWAGRIQVDGTTDVSARLLTVPAGDDLDRDLWPDVTAFPAHVPEAAQLYAQHLDLLDCDDDPGKDPNAPDINPFAVEICNDGIDENCDGNGDEACVDKDGDHDFQGDDCDDNDPKRHHPTDIDPFPDPPNCCGYNLKTPPKGVTLPPIDDHKDYTGDPLLCPMPRCGDGIDESCRGGLQNDPANDTKCVVDADCDTYPAVDENGKTIDCDDHDPNVHPGAPEICGNGKDDNCNGIIDDGCVPCDLDGDGYERSDAANGCPDKNDQHPGMVDCNDYDSGVHPGVTHLPGHDAGGTEGGVGTTGRLYASLLGLCRRVYEDTGVTGTNKIAQVAGYTIGDADCSGTAFEGCPSAACDADGDGWPNGGAGCNPSGGAIDCNDNDPTIYPGAPDKCGDGIAQNCTADTACNGNDKDGDGYVAGVDCDDTNPNVHPWAPEVCDGVDNDCDGLVDEGNPDPSGVPLVTAGAMTSCTDSDIGECGKTKGSCVCSSSVEPMYTDPQGRRMFCPGEQAGGAKPPKCFGAGQPHPQSCDATAPKDDDCDGRNDDPTGMNLAMKGMPCGNNVGQCRQGTIVGCDSTKSNPYVQFGLLPAADAWWVCSTDTVNPQDEICNGFDDDCDGALGNGSKLEPDGSTVPDERDQDGDKYMACTGCPATLGSGYLGCGDCVDGLGGAAIHPGATETCNGIDDNCNNMIDENNGNCMAGQTCCGASSCQNLNTSVNHCGSCAKACSLTTADMCVGGGCQCGTNPECAPGQACTAGKCTNGNGGSCNVAGDCTNGQCVDKVCCGSASCGTCQTCNGSSPGTCTAVKGADDPDSCTGASTCDANGACKKKVGQGCMFNSDCANGQCVDMVCCGVASCLTCQTCNGSTPGSCTPITNADDPNSCTGGNTCDASGVCKKKLGQSCSGNNACVSGFCADGVCCNEACTGQCEACNQTPGTCLPVTGAPVITGGAPVRVACTSDGSSCGGSCDGTNVNACAYPGAGTSCRTASCAANANGAILTGAQVCNGSGTCPASTMGSCSPYTRCNGNLCANTCGGDTGCIAADYCDATGHCKASNGAGTTCTNDCDGGGSSCRVCSAGLQCAASGQCCPTACAPSACVGGNYVTSTCATGTCVPSTTMCGNYTCSAATGCASSCTCATSPCADAANCATGNYCNGSTCVNKGGPNAMCTDNVECLSGTCQGNGKCM